MKYIPIVKEDVPYDFSVSLADKTYDFEVDYNSVGDFFTIKLIYQNKELSNEKIVLGKPLFSGIVYKESPEVSIAPLSEDDNIYRVGYDEFGEDVLLYVIDEGDLNE